MTSWSEPVAASSSSSRIPFLLSSSAPGARISDVRRFFKNFFVLASLRVGVGAEVHIEAFFLKKITDEKMNVSVLLSLGLNVN